MRPELRSALRSTSSGLAAWLLACCACAQSDLPEGHRTVPFTVRSAIEFERVIRLSGDLQSMLEANPVSSSASRSPDGLHFVLQTRKGLVDDNVLMDTLWTVDARELKEFLNSPERGSPVTVSKLLARRTPTEWGVISDLQWFNSREVGFLAADERGVRQAFAVDVDSRRSQQLTFSATDVTAFAASGNTILYYATIAPATTEAYPIGSKDIAEIIDPNLLTKEFPRVDLFVQGRDGPPKAIAAAPMRLLPMFQRIWISSDERWAVAMQPAIAWPKHWEEYRVPDMETFSFSQSRATADGTSLELVNRIQYRLIDIRRGTSRPLLDAPTGFLSGNYTPNRAFWMSDSASVIVSGTFLPLSGLQGEDRRKRARQPAIAEISIESGATTPIVWEPAAIPSVRGGREMIENPIIAIDFQLDQLTVRSATQTSSMLASTDPNSVTSRTYSRAAGSWRLNRSASFRREGGDLSLDLRQALNERPRIHASGGRCRCSKLLWDPNPHADRFSFGRARVFDWLDANGILWHGGLILPPNYDVRQRYPLAMQTHGFHSDEFLIDGPQSNTTAFAAQPLANAGFIVLQIEDNAEASTNDAQEPVRYAEGMRAAIAKLAAEKVIDEARVAVIGWSITGSYVVRLLSENPKLVAAAVISDSAQFGYVPYLLSVNWPSQMGAMFAKYAGHGALAADACELVARDPQYKLADHAPPIRLEAIGAGSVIGMWETYALLRFANRPVDYIYFPAGSHTLQKPAERMASQQGTVDWLRFWLQEYEEPDSAKLQQYARWRRMRDQEMARN